MTINLIVGCSVPEGFDAAEHAILPITPEVVSMLQKRTDIARALFFDPKADADLCSIEFWDQTPEFITIGQFPASIDRAFFDSQVENGIPVGLEPSAWCEFHSRYEVETSFRTKMLCIDKDVDAGATFYWAAYCKHSGARIETCPLPAWVIPLWAKTLEDQKDVG